MFQLTVQPGKFARLRQLNDEYETALVRACDRIPGLHSIEKWLFEDVYVERIEFDGEFSDFTAQLTADRDIRQFLRSVSECFTQPLTAMDARQMSCLQELSAGGTAATDRSQGTSAADERTS